MNQSKAINEYAVWFQIQGGPNRESSHNDQRASSETNAQTLSNLYTKAIKYSFEIVNWSKIFSNPQFLMAAPEQGDSLVE